MTVYDTRMMYIPCTTLQYAEVKDSCKEYLKNASDYEIDLAEQFGIGNTKQKLFLDVLVHRYMTTGRNGGKKTLAISCINRALEKVYHTLNLNPILVLLEVCLHNAPYVDIRTVKQGSINVTKKVFLSQHRRAMCVLKKFKHSKKVVHAYAVLAQQIIHAYRQDSKSKLIAYNTQLYKDAKQASQ